MGHYFLDIQYKIQTVSHFLPLSLAPSSSPFSPSTSFILGGEQQQQQLRQYESAVGHRHSPHESSEVHMGQIPAEFRPKFDALENKVLHV